MQGPMLARAAGFVRIRWARAGLARRRTDDAAGLAARYLADPVAVARLDPRSAAKLDRAFARTQASLGWSRAEAIRHALTTAARRVAEERPTLYLNNTGSSGSHWLVAMLREGAGLLGTGEIYVPLAFLHGRIAPLDAAERPLFLQSVYLAHLMTGGPADAERPLCNSAHIVDLAAYLRNDLPSRKVLLIRDPVEIVVSRTLRKPKFRRWLGRETADDASYLHENIRLVGRFFRKAAPESYDLVVRYEDLVRDPVPALGAIARLLGAAPEEARLRQAADRMRRRDGGPDAAPEALRAIALRELADVRRKLGYG